MRRAAGVLLLLAAWAVLGAWGAGRVASDRWLWSQYLSWIPTAAALVGAILLLLSAWRISPPGRSRARLVTALAIAGVAGYLLLIEWRLHRLASATAPANPALRVLYWNASTVSEGTIADVLGRQAPLDLAVIANGPWAIEPESLGAAGMHVARLNGMAVASRTPIRRWGFTWLGITPDTDAPGWVDPGRALFIEIESPLGLLVVWVVDMPSDVRGSRWVAAGRAGEVIADWTGPAFRPDGAGWTPEPASGFPEPDVVVGDFNAPRGSASLRRLVGRLPNAFDQAGAGYPATWPRAVPVYQIDQAFAGRAVRADTFRTIDPAAGSHRLLLLDLVRR